ncbi:MAG: hypothetical protein NTW21_01430 [Verrucomicrobia bacterium]|nr:hypothetical protein [Verrucomicrobiota bacterium]
MNGGIGGHEGHSVGQLEAIPGQGAAVAEGALAHGRLVDQMEGQAGFDPFGRLVAPPPQQTPGAQAQMLGDEQPDAGLVARNLVGEQLSDVALQTGGVGGLRAFLAPGALGLHHLKRLGRVKGVEFFFEGRNRR